MSLKPFSSSPSPRSPASGDSGGDRKLSGRKYTLSLSFSGMITSGIVMIIAVGWIFAFGVIVGRGYNPEKKLPELARLLPAPEGQQPAETPQPILKPEELTFMKDLKQPGTTAAAPGTKIDASKPGATPGTATGAGSPAKPGPSTKSAEVKPDEDKPKFNFVIQAVAYKNRDQANDLRARMKGEGMRTQMTIEKDSKGKPKWYRVQVLVRGTEADAATTKQTLARMGLKDTQIASKKPVGKSR